MSNDVVQSIKTSELKLVDNSGRECAVLSADEKGAFLSFMGTDKNVRTRMGVSQDGKATLELRNEGAHTNISISVENDGRVLLEGTDNDGVLRFKLGMTGNGSHTELSFSGTHRKPRMILMSEDKGPAGLFILDQHGKALFSTTP